MARISAKVRCQYCFLINSTSGSQNPKLRLESNVGGVVVVVVNVVSLIVVALIIVVVEVESFDVKSVSSLATLLILTVGVMEFVLLSLLFMLEFSSCRSIDDDSVNGGAAADGGGVTSAECTNVIIFSNDHIHTSNSNSSRICGGDSGDRNRDMDRCCVVRFRLLSTSGYEVGNNRIITHHNSLL